MRRGGWLLLGLDVLGLLVIPLIVLRGSKAYPPSEIAGIVAFYVFVLAFGTVGALIWSRVPGNPVGPLLSVSGFAYTAAAVAGEYGHYSVAEAGAALFGTSVALWLSTWAWGVGAGLAATFALLLFPTGRLPSRRWRPAAWLAGTGLILVAATTAFRPGPIDDFGAIDNPVGVSGAAGLLGLLGAAGGIAFVVGLVAALASLLVRFKSVPAEERQQLKWLLYAAGIVALTLPVSVLIQTRLPGEDGVNWSNFLSTASVATAPLAMGLAIFKHRLYDIDDIINRTAVYIALTVCLGLAYYTSVVVLQSVIGGSESPPFVVAASTLAAAALFRPARERIQALIDRRFNRRKYDAALTIESFSARLRDEIDLDSLTDHLIQVVRGTMEPVQVSLWLKAPEDAVNRKGSPT